MPLVYKNQARLEALARKVSGGTVPRLSDMENALFSRGRGKSNELTYYNNQNADAATVNRKLSDARFKFDKANGGNEPRADQAEHIFYKNGNFT